MKPELRIHVGLPKTGTSALQRFMFEQRGYLADRNVYYPAEVVEFRHQQLVSQLCNQLLPGVVDRFLPKPGSYLTTVWSAEGFSHNLYRFSMRSLAVLLDATSEYNRRVFVVLRERQKFLWSLYKQCLINPVVPSVGYYAQDISFEDFAAIPYIGKLADFSQLTKDLGARLGADVAILDYDTLDVSEMFERITGVSVPKGISIGRLNASFPDAAIAAIRRANATLSGAARQAKIDEIVAGFTPGPGQRS